MKILKQKLSFFQDSNSTFQEQPEPLVTPLPFLAQVDPSKQTLLDYLHKAHLKTIKSELKNLGITEEQILVPLDSKAQIKKEELFQYLEMAYIKQSLEVIHQRRKSNSSSKRKKISTKNKKFFISIASKE